MNMEGKHLPVGWRLDTLRNVLTSLESGSRPEGGVQNIKHGIPSISAEHMDQYGGFKFEELKYIPKDFYDHMPRGKIQKGDILIVKDGATTGKVSIVEDNFPFKKAAINEHVFICRVDREIIIPDYLFYWVYSIEGQNSIKNNFHGAAIGGINRKFVDRLFVPIPPLIEQRRIVDILKCKLKCYENARKSTIKQLEASQSYHQSILRQLFQNIDIKSKDHVSLRDICIQDGQYGISQKSHFQEIGVPILGMGNISKGKLIWEKINYVELTLDQLNKYRLNKGDILFNRTNSAELVGKSAVFDDNKEAVFASYLIRFVTNTEIANPYYIAAYINSPEGRLYVHRNMGRAIGQVNISASKMHNMLIPLPSTQIQIRYVDIYLKKIKMMSSIENALVTQLNILKHIPNSLFHLAFSGGLGS